MELALTRRCRAGSHMTLAKRKQELVRWSGGMSGNPAEVGINSPSTWLDKYTGTASAIMIINGKKNLLALCCFDSKLNRPLQFFAQCFRWICSHMFISWMKLYLYYLLSDVLPPVCKRCARVWPFTAIEKDQLSLTQLKMLQLHNYQDTLIAFKWVKWKK